MTSMADNEAVNDPIVKEFIERLVPMKPHIEKVVLFGSRARGTQTPWSDYDFLIVVDERSQTLVDKIYDAVVVIQADTGKDLSLKIIPRAAYDRPALAAKAFLNNVAREGIVLG